MSFSKSVSQDQFSQTGREIDLQLLAIDLNTCERCVGTMENIETAIGEVKNVLAITDTKIKVQRILIESEEQAKAYQFVSSPTIRISGHDIVFDTLESKCDSCSDLCNSEEGTDCRLWQYQGEEYTEAPVGLIVQSLMQEIFGGGQRHSEQPSGSYTVPENLQRFFAGKAEQETQAVSSCCSSEKQESCCAPSEKANCCQSGESATCGCQ